MISGGLNGQEIATLHGGYGTDNPTDPTIPPANENTNQTTAGDPVNVANGNVTRDETDLTLPGVGMSLAFSRHYDSQSAADSGMGIGWTYSYSDFLTAHPDGSIDWRNDSGNQFRFTLVTGGGYATPDSLHGTLTAVAGGYRFTDKYGLVHEFDSGGKLTQIRDRNGNGAALAYAGGRLATVSQLAAPTRTLNFAWTNGHITAVTDFTGRQWTYAYSGDYLASVTSPSDASTPVAVVRYDYYPNSDQALGGLLRQITEADGAATTYSYYPNRAAFQVTDAESNQQTLRYDFFRNRTAWADERKNVTFYDFDAQGRTTAFTYNDAGQVLTQSTDLPSTISHAYDDVGNVTASTDRNGRTTRNAFDALNRRTSEEWLDGSGTAIRTFRYSYDAAGQTTGASDPDSSYAYTYDLAGRPATVDNLGTPGVPNVVLSYAYDAAGNRISAADSIAGAARGVEAVRYDALVRVTQITQTGKGVADKRIDLSHNSTSELTGLSRYADLTGTTLVAASAYAYDGAGRLAQLVHSHDAATLAKAERRNNFANSYVDGTRRVPEIADGTRRVPATICQSYFFALPKYQWAFDAASRVTRCSGCRCASPGDPPRSRRVPTDARSP
jgi:YD repeat-containing protein